MTLKGISSHGMGNKASFTGRYDISGMFRDTSLDAATKEISRQKIKYKKLLQVKKEENKRQNLIK